MSQEDEKMKNARFLESKRIETIIVHTVDDKKLLVVVCGVTSIFDIPNLIKYKLKGICGGDFMLVKDESKISVCRRANVLSLLEKYPDSKLMYKEQNNLCQF